MGKKKKGKALAGGAALLCVLIGVEAALSWQNSQEETETGAEAVRPLEISADELTAVTVKNEAGTFTLVKDADGVWSNEEDGEFPLDEDTWTAKLSSLESMTAERTLEEPGELEEYGLEDAAVQVTLVTEDGSTELYIGSQNESTYDYYVYVDSPDTVYTVGSAAATAMDCGLYDLAAASEFPSIAASGLTHVGIFAEESSLDFTVEGTGADTGSWYVSRDGEKAVQADSTAVSALNEEASYLGFEDFVDYRGEDLARYGLDTPMMQITWDYTETETVEEETEDAADATEEETEDAADATEEETETVEIEKQVTLLIGDPVYQETEAEAYYVKLSDSREVYTMAASELELWLEAEYTDYVNKYISQVPQTALSVLTVTYNGKSYELTVESEIQTEIVYTYLVNGRKADETAYQTFYGLATSIMAQAITEEPLSGEPDFAFRFEKTDGTQVTAEYYLGSDGMYTVLCSTGLCGKVSKLEADDMMDAFRELAGLEADGT